MKSIMVVFACAVLLLLVAACGGRDDSSDLRLANEALQEEIEMLRQEMTFLFAAHVSLQDELRFVQAQVDSMAVHPANGEYQENGEYQDEFPMFHHDLQSLLNEPGLDRLSIEQIAWQNISATSAGMEYILWRGSWANLGNTEHYVNLLVSHGWELVNMFGAGQHNGIVVVMRR